VRAAGRPHGGERPMSEDPRIANARRALAQVEDEDLNVWAKCGILTSSLEMLLTYVDGESLDEWTARVIEAADQ
jgi:hypothetical protein